MKLSVFFNSNLRKICLKVYLIVLQMVLLSVVLALIVTYVDEIGRAFHNFSSNNKIVHSELAFFFYLCPVLLTIFYSIFQDGKKLSSLNLPHLINVFMFVPIHFFILNFGNEFVFLHLLLSWIIFTVCYICGLTMKKNIQRLRQHILLAAILFLVLFLFGAYILENTIVTFIAFCLLALLGAAYTLVEAQALKYKIILSQEKHDFYKIINSSVLNFMCNFYLMFVLFDIVRFFIKSCVYRPEFIQLNKQNTSE